jgi:hypothetical protein
MSELVAYRGRTIGLLRRYFRMSIELGRLPSLLGREFFRAKVTSYRMSTFEDVVIFVHDVERCLDRLDEFSRQLVARIVLQEHTQAEAARLLGAPLRTVQRQFPEALDRLSEIFIRASLLAEIESIGGTAKDAVRPRIVDPERELPPKRPVQPEQAPYRSLSMAPVLPQPAQNRRFFEAPGTGCQEEKEKTFSASA